MQIDMNDLTPEIAAYIKSLEEKIEEQNIRISNLTEMIIKTQKKMFGKSSESIENIEGAEQLTLFNGCLPHKESKAHKGRTYRKA